MQEFYLQNTQKNESAFFLLEKVHANTRVTNFENLQLMVCPTDCVKK